MLSKNRRVWSIFSPSPVFLHDAPLPVSSGPLADSSGFFDKRLPGRYIALLILLLLLLSSSPSSLIKSARTVPVHRSFPVERVRVARARAFYLRLAGALLRAPPLRPRKALDVCDFGLDRRDPPAVRYPFRVFLLLPVGLPELSTLSSIYLYIYIYTFCRSKRLR